MDDAGEMRVIDGLEALGLLLGTEVACSQWLSVDQARVQAFADATGDQQWIHTDPVRAGRESPYGAPVAHGFLTLSLLPGLMGSCLRIDGIAMAVNYGLDRLRFPAPVKVGQRIRARLQLDQLAPIAGGVQAHWTVTVQVEALDKPACVAQMLARYYASVPQA